MTCPGCSSPIEYVANPEHPERSIPQGMAWFVCRECGSISRFDGKRGVTAVTLRPATVDEFADLTAGHRGWLVAMRKMVLLKAGAKR